MSTTTTTTTTLADAVEAEVGRFAQVTEGIGTVSFTVDADAGPIILHCMDFQAVLTGPMGDGATAWAVTFGPHVPHSVVIAAFGGAITAAGADREF